MVEAQAQMEIIQMMEQVLDGNGIPLLPALPRRRRRRRRSGCESFNAPAPVPVPAPASPFNCSLPATPRLCCPSSSCRALQGQFLQNTPNPMTSLYYTHHHRFGENVTNIFHTTIGENVTNTFHTTNIGVIDDTSFYTGNSF